MTWNPTIALASQQWANYLNTSNLFQHSGTALYGENLAYLQGYGTDPVVLAKKSIDLWYAEVSKYDFAKPGFSDTTGHFTCLVWVSSTQFGMGVAINSQTNAVDIVMNTSPPGNVIGQFQQNVLPSPSPSPSPVSVPVPVPVPYTPTNTVSDLYAVLQLLNTNTKKAQVISAIQNIIAKLSV
jgi:hypothetical protein